MDQSKKTMRHFYCRDVLWETFEQMANDFDCSIDYLVNEAMRYYARSKNYQSPGAPQMTGGAPVAGGPDSSSGPTSYPPAKGAGGAGGPAPRNQGGTQPPPQPAAVSGAGTPGTTLSRSNVRHPSPALVTNPPGRGASATDNMARQIRRRSPSRE